MFLFDSLIQNEIYVNFNDNLGNKDHLTAETPARNDTRLKLVFLTDAFQFSTSNFTTPADIRGLTSLVVISEPFYILNSVFAPFIDDFWSTLIDHT